MDIIPVLQGIGLSQGEAKVYLALLKSGPSPASKIKEETKLHRTTIYDFVEKLLNKGLLSFVIQNNVKYYRAAHPDKLLAVVKEKEAHIKEVMPDLKKLAEFQEEEVKVEVFKGVEGFKTILNDVLRTKEDMTGLGIDEVRFQKRFPHLMERFFNEEERLGITERLVTSESAEFIFTKKATTYRFVPEEFFGPTPTISYGDKVLMLIWEPLTLIRVTNAQLADSYRKHFEMVWRMAKKTPPEHLKRLSM